MAFGDGDINFWEQFLEANIFNVITLAFCLVSLVVFYNRKHHFPIQGRGSNAILLAAWIYFFLLLRIAFRGPHLPCVVDITLYVTGSHCGCAIYLYRVAVLLVKHDIARDVSLTASASTLRSNMAWRYGRVHILNTKLWAIVLLVYGILISSMVFLIAGVSGNKWSCVPDRNSLVNSVGNMNNLALLIILTPLFVGLGCLLRKYPADGRRISAEFRFVGLFMCGGFTVYLITSQLVPGVWLAPLASCYMDIIGIGLFGSSLCYPIFLTYQYQELPSASVRGSLSWTMEELLIREDFRGAFLIHLKAEFSAESLMFWQSVTDFKGKGQREVPAMKADVMEIWAIYIERNSPYKLNVSDETEARTKASIQHACESGTGLLEVFDQLLAEVVTLLKNDPLPRFLRSPEGLKLLEAQEDAIRHVDGSNRPRPDPASHTSPDSVSRGSPGSRHIDGVSQQPDTSKHTEV